MRTRIVALAVVVNLFITAAPGLAHHSDVAYETSAIELKNITIVSVAWRNPHGVIVCDVKDDAGKVTRWTMEMGSPSQMLSIGWNRNTVAPGDEGKIDMNPAKNGTPFGRLKRFTKADGTVLNYQTVVQ